VCVHACVRACQLAKFRNTRVNVLSTGYWFRSLQSKQESEMSVKDKRNENNIRDKITMELFEIHLQSFSVRISVLRFYWGFTEVLQKLLCY